MENGINKLVDTLAELQERANVNACFGEPVVVEGRTVIPVASVGYGFGMGMGEGTAVEDGEDTEESTGSGGGGGGGMGARPLAAIEVTSEDVRVEPIMDEQKIALAGILLSGWAIFWLAAALISIFGPREE